MLTKLDDLIYKAASKPLIDLLQKWFHFNRFQMIASLLKSIVNVMKGMSIGLAVATLVLVLFSRDTTYLPQIILGSVLTAIMLIHANRKEHRQRPLLEDLKRCSRILEEGGWPRSTSAMIVRKEIADRARSMDTGYLILTLVYWGIASAFGFGKSIAALPLVIIATMELFENHLWRSSDIDPRDRRSIMEPKGHTSSAS